MALKYYCLAAALVAARSACASQWFLVTGPELQTPAAAFVEIDLESLRTRSPVGEAVIRVTHDTDKIHAAGFSYRSFVATAQFNCQNRSVSLLSAAYYQQPAGQRPMCRCVGAPT